MYRELLVLSWLNGQIRFVALSHGHCSETWECEERVPLENPSDVARLLSEGIARTQYRGKHLAIVLEHNQLTQQLLETPPAKGRDLDQFLARQIDQLKIFEGNAAFSYHVAHPTRGSSSVMLYLLPGSIRDILITAAHEAGLHLLILVAPSALFFPLIADLPIGKEETALLGIEVQGTTSLVAGRKDGEVFLTRSLQCNWERDPERIASQINRSTVFVRQQFGVDITQIHLIGRGAAEAAPVMQGKVNLPVTTETPDQSSSWMPSLVANFPARMSANLITREQQRAPQRRRELIITTAVLGLVAFTSLAVSLWVEVQLHKEGRKLESLLSKKADLLTRKVDLEKRFTGLTQDVQFVRFVERQPLPPVPALFAAYVASKFPDQLILTKLEVNRLDPFCGEKNPPKIGSWTVRLEGGPSWHASDEADSGQVYGAYVSLRDELTRGPFRISITHQNKQFAPRRDKPSWSTLSKDQSDLFLLEGIIGEEPPIK